MVAIPVKPENGPTLGTLLAPRWHAAAALTRRLVIAGGLLLTGGIVALVLTLLNVNYSHGGPVPFSFSYRGLYRVAPDPGGYIRIEKRSPHGRLLYSFAVDPLTVPPYTGEQSAALPLYASSYIRARRRSDPTWVLRGEGKTRVNTVPAYDVLYTTVVEGREMYGRDVLLLQQHAGARRGVDIVMLTAPGASKQIDGPMEIATTGTLLHPLRSLSLG
jgi:hypothetical protein